MQVHKRSDRDGQSGEVMCGGLEELLLDKMALGQRRATEGDVGVLEEQATAARVQELCVSGCGRKHDAEAGREEVVEIDVENILEIIDVTSFE